ncbi:putative ankyrin repeat domain-containing protein 20A5 [Arvicola amphibius]|uniref:putative ankyrin repeat domain-containing protein 20A5 n=1 Tax=Arvicola amphibius TaxID=1047088 RepID=UPI001C0A2BEE|nr:putative ankyrin repeat domain-containing protein 20A5 [Arvicola amphibius]
MLKSWSINVRPMPRDWIDLVSAVLERISIKLEVSVLHFACSCGHLELVWFFVLSGCDINATTNKYMTPLIQAVQKMQRDIIIFLLQERTDPNWKDTNGKTALHHAVLSDVPEIAAALLAPGGKIEQTSKYFIYIQLSKIKHVDSGTPRHLLEDNGYCTYSCLFD